MNSPMRILPPKPPARRKGASTPGCSPITLVAMSLVTTTSEFSKRVLPLPSSTASMARSSSATRRQLSRMMRV